MNRSAGKSKLLTHEDYWAIGIGGFLLLTGFVVFFVAPKQDFARRVEELKKTEAHAQSAEQKDGIRQELNSLSSSQTRTGESIAWLLRKPFVWNHNPVDAFYISQKGHLLPSLTFFGVLLAILFGVGAHFMGFGFWSFIKAFIGIFVMAILAQLLGAQADMKIWALVMLFGPSCWAYS